MQYEPRQPTEISFAAYNSEKASGRKTMCVCGRGFFHQFGSKGYLVTHISDRIYFLSDHTNAAQLLDWLFGSSSFAGLAWPCCRSCWIR